MSIKQENIVAGIGTLYLAPYGEAYPATTGASLTWGANWKEVGATKGGVEIQITTEFFAIEIDQKNAPIGHEITKQSGKIVAVLAETDIARMTTAIANAKKTDTVGGPAQVALSTLEVGPATPHTVYSLGFETKAPGSPVNTSYWRMFKFWRVIAMGTLGLAYKKGEVTVMNVEFDVEEDSSKDADTSLFAVVDMTGPTVP